jgi:hypothetical protein
VDCTHWIAQAPGSGGKDAVTRTFWLLPPTSATGLFEAYIIAASRCAFLPPFRNREYTQHITTASDTPIL